MKKCEYEIDGFCFHPKNKELRLLATPCNWECNKENNNKGDNSDKIITNNIKIKRNEEEEHKMNQDNTEEFCFNPAHLKPGVLAIKKDECEYCHT